MIARVFTVLTFMLAALIALPASAQNFPQLTGRVVDQANLLSPADEAELTQLSAGIEQATSRQFVIATIPDLQGYDIADYGYQLGRAWKIGQEGANNGILLIVAPNERKVRIEVGYGLEPIMPDALASQIIRRDITPKFKSGDMPGGIKAGANAIAEQMRLPLEAAEAKARERLKRGQGNKEFPLVLIWIIILIVFVVLPIIVSAVGKGKRYRGRGGSAPVIIWGPSWGGGSSSGGSSWGGGGSSWGGGGGGFSGGGGSFGGGGASGGW